jgi:hypothetical protein
MRALNRNLEARIASERPDAIFLRNPVCIYPSTLARIRRDHPRTVLASYCNDNPFDDGREWRVWRHYIGDLRKCHLNYFFRSSNVERAQAKGVPSPKLLLSYFVEGLHQPQSTVRAEFRNPVVFSGHYEPDGRHLFLEHLQRNGVPVKLFGSRWEELDRKSILRQQHIRSAWGAEYVESIAGADIALVFLSGRNRDTYTQRCFEIPACRTLMIAPRTQDLCNLFQEDVEALYFSSPQELLEKVKGALANPSRSARIAEAGYHRCIRDQHSNTKRAGEVLDDIQLLSSHLQESSGLTQICQ